MEFITNQKRGQSLLWNGCRFTLNRKLDNGTCYWRCHKKSCAARMTTLGTDILQQTNGHTHAVNPATTQVEEIKRKLRMSAREKVTPVPTLYN